MTQIDWSKAPADATHYHPRVGGYQEHWIKPGFFCVTGFEAKGWVSDLGHAAMKLAVPRPVSWNGEGLPPVGLEVLTTHKGRDFRVKILAYAPKNGEQAVMAEETEPGNNFGCLFAWMAGMCAFRPIRTAEQIAAEERDSQVAGIDQAFRSFVADRAAQETGYSGHELANHLYDAGYRKVEQ